MITDAGAEDGTGSEILEVDPQGNIVWRYDRGLVFAHSAKRMANGNTLIADTTNNRVLEVTPLGDVAFSSERWGNGTGRLSDGSHLHYPNDAHQMLDGTLLITDRNNDRFVQVDREGEILRSHTGNLKHPHNCDPLPTGNVIISNSDDNCIIEINRNGEVVWKYEDQNNPLSWPRDADRLVDGNILITDSKNHRVFEITSEGKVIWEYVVPYFANFYDADRLENGNTLISDQQHHQIIEVDPAGKVVWTFRNYVPLCTINERLRNTSFKEVDEQNFPTSWILSTRLSEGGGILVWTKNERGKNAPGLEFDRPGALCLQQTVRVQPGILYHVSSTIRTEDVEKTACVMVAYLDDMAGLVEDVVNLPKGNLFTGTNSWTIDNFETEAPENAASAEIRLFINGPGKAYVKNINLFY